MELVFLEILLMNNIRPATPPGAKEDISRLREGLSSLNVLCDVFSYVQLFQWHFVLEIVIRT